LTYSNVNEVHKARIKFINIEDDDGDGDYGDDDK